MSSFKVNQFKDIVVAEAQARPEFTRLPPIARKFMNEALEETASELSAGIVNDIDLSANKELTDIPKNLVGPTNPVDLVSSNLDVTSLTNNLDSKITGALTDALTDRLTTSVVSKFNSKLPPILRSKISTSAIQNALSGGLSSGLNKGIKHELNLFSGEALSGRIPQLPSVPNIGGIYDKLSAKEAFADVNKKFDTAAATSAIQDAANFNVQNEENTKKQIVTNTGFVSPTATFPTRDYSARTETNKLATGDVNGTITFEKTEDRILGCKLPNNESFDQPLNPYNARYPFNKVIETESGHIIEMDDTPGAERLHIYHTNGTFIELDQSGSIVERTKGSQYRFVDKNDHLSVMGEGRVSIGGSLKVYCSGNVDLEVEGDTNLRCFNDVTMEASGTLNLSATEEINLNSANINIESSNFVNLKTEGNAFITAKDSIHNKCNSSMFLHTLKDMHINSDENFNLLAAKDMSLIATSKMVSSADSIHEQATTYNEKATTINMNNPSYSVADNPPNIASVATYANDANIGTIGDRNSVIIETIDDPEYSNYLDNVGYETEDTELDEEADQFEKSQIISGVASPGRSDPVEVRRSTASPTISTIVQPDIGLKSAQFVPGNMRISPNFTLEKLSSKAYFPHDIPRQGQVGLSYGEIVFNLQAMALNVCEPVKELFPNMFITSGFRKVTADGSKTSDHLKGQAIDMQFKNTRKKEYFDIAEKIANNINFDKVLLEYKDTGSGLPWIHISFKVDQPRKLMFTYFNHRKTHNQFVDLA
ncbi:hypothetical protein [Marinobacter sp.]|uniref:hypothetical protein n=1 Tax=Marinobacter sp. TaxID=50741 RepID=UPI00257BCF4D|nr:hypothetical protein [Marinobacter sp.]